MRPPCHLHFPSIPLIFIIIIISNHASNQLTMLVKTYAGAVHGVDARTITIETNVGGPMGNSETPPVHIVGLPDSAVRESLARIEAAVKNSGYRYSRLR